MKIGVPKEIKPQEHRIGLTPESVKTLVSEGHEVIVENNGGFEAGFDCFKACYEAGVYFKATGDCLITAPQFICEEKHIDEIIDKLRTGITNYQKNQKN